MCRSEKTEAQSQEQVMRLNYPWVEDWFGMGGGLGEIVLKVCLPLETLFVQAHQNHVGWKG